MSAVVTVNDGAISIITIELAEHGGCLRSDCHANHFAKPKRPGGYVQALTCPKCGEPVVVGVSDVDPRWLFFACDDCELSLAVAPLMPYDVAVELAAASPPRAHLEGKRGDA